MAAGVSTATVSRCLNEPDKVSKATRERVMGAVDRLNYTPNFGARAIAANRTGIFGAIIPTMENAIFARGIEAFQKALVERNATMLVASSDYDPEQEAKQIKTLVARGADGLLLIGIERDPEIYRFLSDREIPVVCAWNCTADLTRSYVGFDNELASRMLVKHALAFGHESFAYVSAATRSNDRAKARVSGAKHAIMDAGFDPDQMPVIETEYSIGNGREAFLQLAENRPADLPTLIFCGNDVLAVGVIQAIQAVGLRVPRDISVVGFDDIEIATIISPSLTTVHVPHQDMGRVSAENLYNLVLDNSEPVHIKLDTYIVDRDSLGAAPR